MNPNTSKCYLDRQDIKGNYGINEFSLHILHKRDVELIHEALNYLKFITNEHADESRITSIIKAIENNGFDNFLPQEQKLDLTLGV